MTMRGRARPETLVYDRAGRLARVERPNQPPLSYRYDGDGRLVGRSEGASETRFVHDGDDLLAERRDGLSVQHFPGELAGERFGFVLPTGTPRYLVQAPDGSTLAVVSGAGEVVTTALHEPFGPLVGLQGAAPDAFHYRGHYTDPATGLVHFAMRWYDPELGVFCAPDPDAGDFMAPATLHRYAYLGGDPVNRIDPLGAQAHEWQTGRTCLEQVCNLFQQGKILAGNAMGKALDGFNYAGAIEKNGWNYDVWVKHLPGTDKVVTIFRDLNEKAEGYFGKTNFTGNIVLKDPPAISQPLGGAVPTAGNAGANSGGVRQTIRDGLTQVKQGVQIYGKEMTTTVGGLGGLSGTLGTGVGTLAALPGGLAIIGAGVAVAGVIGYGVGSVINLIPGISEGAQGVLISVMGYENDQTLADQKAKADNEGAKAKEHAAKTIRDNLAKDTLPPPPEPGIAGAPVNIGEPAAPTREHEHAPKDAPDAAAPDIDDDDDTDEDEDDTAADTVVPGILDRVAARSIIVTFKVDSDVSTKDFKNIVTCNETLTFWNVGALAPGYASATLKSVCVASLNGSREESVAKGTFSGGPSGTIDFSSDGTSVSFMLHGGTTMTLPEVGEHPLPAGAFSDWPPDLNP